MILKNPMEKKVRPTTNVLLAFKAYSYSYSMQVKETWKKLCSNLIFIQDYAKKCIQKHIRNFKRENSLWPVLTLKFVSFTVYQFISLS